MRARTRTPAWSDEEDDEPVPAGGRVMSAVAHLPGGDTEPPAPSSAGAASRLTPTSCSARASPGWLIFFAVPMVFLFSHLAADGIPGGGLHAHLALRDLHGRVCRHYWPQFIRSFVYAGDRHPRSALLIGYPLAYAIAFKSGRWKNILLVLVIAPFFTSFLIRTLAWQTILSDNGPVVDVLPGDRT